MKKIVCFCFSLMFAGLVWAGPVDKEVADILDQYFLIHSSLANDSQQGVDEAAHKIMNLAMNVQTEDAQAKKLMEQVHMAAHQMNGKDLKQTRDLFFELSKPLLAYLNQYYSGDRTFYRYFCSMAKKAWIQPAKDVRNPYLGSEMPTCGELIS